MSRVLPVTDGVVSRCNRTATRGSYDQQRQHWQMMGLCLASTEMVVQAADAQIRLASLCSTAVTVVRAS